MRPLAALKCAAPLAAMGAFIALALAAGCAQSGDEKGQTAVRPPARPAAAEAYAVTIDLARQQRGGIVTEALETVSRREEMKAYATVLSPGGLVSLRGEFASSRARLEKARANLEVSRQQYDRARALNAEGKNISDKALQAAEAAWQSDRIEAQASEEALRFVRDAARLKWGDVIAGWLAGGRPALGRLLRQEDLLVQISLPPQEQIDRRISGPPPSAVLRTPQGALLSVALVSPAPSADALLQGVSYFYLASAENGELLPGMNMDAYLPAGAEARGFVIPLSAVLWRQGAAWVYVQRETVHFARRVISTANPVKGGFFVTEGFKAGERIVVRGAQSVLSEEFASETSGAGEDED
jgi:hypothetical protein